jgi:carboxymethylenebutenolidase
MKRLTFTLLCSIFALTFFSSNSSAQDWAQAKLKQSPRHREWATVKHDSRAVQTFIVYPESKDKRPVVLIIHEIFGLTDWALRHGAQRGTHFGFSG